MEDLIKEFNECTKIMVFEIEVQNIRTQEKDYVLFDLEIRDSEIIATHEALTTEEQESNRIAFKSIQLDEVFSLDEHLQELHEECIIAILESDFFTLTD